MNRTAKLAAMIPMGSELVELEPVDSLTTRNPRTKHAENPDRVGYALCGIRLRGGSSSPAGDRCVVCRELTRPSWIDR